MAEPSMTHPTGLIARISIVILLFFITPTVCEAEQIDLGWNSGNYPQNITYPLKLLRNTDSVHGSFFLGSGSINYNPVYFFFYKMPNGAYKAGWLEADNRISIFEENRKDAIIIIHINDCTFWNGEKYCLYNFSNIEFHIPIGTINNSYTLK